MVKFYWSRHLEVQNYPVQLLLMHFTSGPEDLSETKSVMMGSVRLILLKVIILTEKIKMVSVQI